MAVLSVYEIAEARTGTLDAALHRTYTRTFQVVTTSHLDDAAVARTAPGLPLLYASYITDTGHDIQAIATDIQATQPDREDPTLWKVTVKYESHTRLDPAKQVGGSPGGPSDEPTFKPPEYSWDWVQGKAPFTRTTDGYDVVNSAGDPYEGEEIDRPLLTLTVVRNEARFSADRAYFYMNTINSDSFQGFQPRQARIVEYSGKSKFERNRAFCEVTYRFAFQTPDWDVRKRDYGPYYIDPGDGKKHRFTSQTGIGDKGRLDGTGRRLDPQGELPDVIGRPTVYLTKKAYFATDFASLHIPDYS